MKSGLRLTAIALIIGLGESLDCPVASANDLINTYHEALAQDPTLAAALHARDVALEAYPQARAAFLPQLSGSASITRDRQHIDSATSRASSLGTFYSTNKQYGASLTQQIWSFENFYLLKEADIEAAAAENTYQEALQDLILRVAQAYFGVLAANDTLQTTKAQKVANAALLEQAKKRFQVGLAAITDVQEAQAQSDVSDATMIAAERSLSNAKRALGVITGQYADAFPQLRTDIPLVQPQPATVDGWLAAAKRGNYGLRGAQLNVQIAQRDSKAKFAKHLPTFDLVGQYGKSETGGNFGSSGTDGQIGVQLSVPIFSGGYTQSLVREADALCAQRESELTGEERSVDQQTRDAFQGVESGIAAVKANRRAMESNETALRASQMGLQVGTRTEIDVLTSLQNLTNAQQAFYQSRYDYLTSILTLKQQAGRLREEDLAEIDALLVAGTKSAPPSARSN